MKKTVLRKYAQLIAQTGVNVQPGQEVFIAADLDQPEFVKMLVEECYKRKAKKVVVDWSYQPLQKLHYRYRTMTTLSKLDNYEEARWQHYVDTIPCRIYLLSEDPDGLNGINQEKMAKSQQRKYPIIKKYRDQIENKYQWCIAAVPGAAWAKKLFPGLRTSQAMEKLWEAILSTSRVDEDPLAAWDAHNQDLHDRCQYLNSLHLRQLKYKSANGTDLTVGLIPEGRFLRRSAPTGQETYFRRAQICPRIELILQSKDRVSLEALAAELQGQKQAAAAERTLILETKYGTKTYPLDELLHLYLAEGAQRTDILELSLIHI